MNPRVNIAAIGVAVLGFGLCAYWRTTPHGQSEPAAILTAMIGCALLAFVGLLLLWKSPRQGLPSKQDGDTAINRN